MKRTLVAMLALLLSSAAVADVDAENNIRQAMSQLAPDLKLDSVKASPVAGLYEVVFGSEVIYLSSDGKYLIQGSIIETATRKNLTEDARSAGRNKVLNDLKEENLVVFAPEETKYTVTVFTDIDCGYCRKLHDEMDAYNALGIKIRYVAYPRAGVGSTAFNKAETVWCAEDRQSAMTIAKAGKSLEESIKAGDITLKENCVSPVKDQYMTARALNLSGTPALFLESGELIPGYVSAERLIERLKQ